MFLIQANLHFFFLLLLFKKDCEALRDSSLCLGSPLLWLLKVDVMLLWWVLLCFLGGDSDEQPDEFKDISLLHSLPIYLFFSNQHCLSFIG